MIKIIDNFVSQNKIQDAAAEIDSTNQIIKSNHIFFFREIINHISISSIIYFFFHLKTVNAKAKEIAENPPILKLKILNQFSISIVTTAVEGISGDFV